MSRVSVVLVALLATLAPVARPAAWGCLAGGSFWHLPGTAQGGGYLALGGAVVTLLRVDTEEVVEQKLADAGGGWSFDVSVPGDFVVAVSGFATLAGPSGGVYYFGDPPRGYGDGTPVASCNDGSIEFGPLHVLQGIAAPPPPLRRSPRVSVHPSRARSGARFRLKARHFAPGERLLIVEERPDETAYASTLETNPRGVGRLYLVGPQLVGRHRWCFRGETSHQEACVTYRVRQP